MISLTLINVTAAAHGTILGYVGHDGCLGDASDVKHNSVGQCKVCEIATPLPWLQSPDLDSAFDPSTTM